MTPQFPASSLAPPACARRALAHAVFLLAEQPEGACRRHAVGAQRPAAPAGPTSAAGAGPRLRPRAPAGRRRASCAPTTQPQPHAVHAVPPAGGFATSFLPSVVAVVAR